MWNSVRQLKGNIGDEVHRSDHVKDGQSKKEGTMGYYVAWVAVF